VFSLQGRLQAVTVAEEERYQSSRKWEEEAQARMHAQHESLLSLESSTQAKISAVEGDTEQKLRELRRSLDLQA
jgi:hypothetical protein